MSRDWRPFELLSVNEGLIANGKGDLRNISLKLIQPNGEKVDFPLPNFRLKQKYPNLSFLFDNLVPLIKSMDNLTVCDETIEMIERTLTNVIAKFKEQPYAIVDQEIFNTVEKWFYGKLDECFYYNTDNNRLLSEFIYQNYCEKLGVDISELDFDEIDLSR